MVYLRDKGGKARSGVDIEFARGRIDGFIPSRGERVGELRGPLEGLSQLLTYGFAIWERLSPPNAYAGLSMSGSGRETNVKSRVA